MLPLLCVHTKHASWNNLFVKTRSLPRLRSRSPTRSRACLWSGMSNEAPPETGVWCSSAERCARPWYAFAGGGSKKNYILYIMTFYHQRMKRWLKESVVKFLTVSHLFLLQDDLLLEHLHSIVLLCFLVSGQQNLKNKEEIYGDSEFIVVFHGSWANLCPHSH